jgi:hypothetical protein
MTFARQNAKDLDLEPVPKLNLFSLSNLEERLGYTRDRLRMLAANAGAHYDPFIKAPKVRWFARIAEKPKKRTIDNPDPELSRVQKRIYRKLLRNTILPHYICGGVRGRNLLHNFCIHRGAKVLVTIDIKSFFPSITNHQVYFLWRRVLNCSPEIAALLTQLTTFERHVPQGAATSTALANILICTIFRKIKDKCDRIGVRCSTWVDDLAFSGLNARTVISTAITALRNAGFKVSRRKIKVMGAGSQKILNGIIVGKYPGLLRENTSRVRAGIHKLVSGAVDAADHPAYLRSLVARIRQAATINPRQVDKLRLRLIDVLSKGAVTKGLKRHYIEQLQRQSPALGHY